MEERVTSPTAKDDDHPQDNRALALPPGHNPLRSGTYLIQLPKDQIYRVPPPENALIVEQYKNPAKKKSSQSARLAWIIAIVAIVIIVTGISVLAYYLNKKPKNPTFTIQNIVAKNSSSHHRSHVTFNTALQIDNPNSGTTMSYRPGTVVLKYDRKEIGKGDFTSFDIGGKSSKNLQLVLDGSKVLPKNITKSMNEKHPKPKSKSKEIIYYDPSRKDISLSFSIKVPVNMASALKSWEKNMVVTCNFQVNTLGKGTEILSQDCQIED